MAALPFLLPTGDSRSGRRSLIPNSSPFSRSTRFPFTSTASPPLQPQFFLAPTQRLAPQLAATPWGGSPPPPPRPKNCYPDCTENFPLCPPPAPRRVRDSKNRPAHRAQATPRVQGGVG